MEFCRPEYWSVFCRGSLLQGIFLTRGLNPGLPHCRRILYGLSCEGSPRMVFGSCALGPVLTAACRGIRPGVPRFLLMHRALLCAPQQVLSAPRSPRRFLSSQGTLGARPAPCGGTWASPGHGMQRMGRGGFVSVSPCTSVLFQAGQAAPHDTSRQDLLCDPLSAALWPGQPGVSALLTDGSRGSAVGLGCDARAEGHRAASE